MSVTAVPITKLFAWGEGDSGPIVAEVPCATPTLMMQAEQESCVGLAATSCLRAIIGVWFLV